MYSLDRSATLLGKLSEWSIYLLIFVLPFSKSLIEITIVLAMVSLLTKKLIMKEPIIRPSRIDIMLFVFLGASLFSFFNTEHFALSARAFFSKTLEYAILFLMVKEIINTKEKLNNFLIMAGISCVIILADGFIQYYITHVDLLHSYPSFKYVSFTPNFLGAPTASFPYPNDFAAWILMFIFPLSIFSLGSAIQNRLQQIFLILTSCGLFFSLYLTKVRSAWVAFIVTLGILIIYSLRKTGLVILIALLILASVLSIGLLNRRQDMVEYIFDLTSIKDRFVMWRNGWDIFMRHPVIGNGINTFFAHYKNIRQDESRGIRGSYAHNCYLQMAADVGLVGLTGFLLFAGGVLVRAFKHIGRIKDPSYRSLILGTTFGLVAFMLHSFVDTSLYSLNLAVLFWLSLGVLTATVNVALSERL